jgi:exfoliative toxin A/B
MFTIFKRTPIPIAGLMLGLVGTGNLIIAYGKQYRYLAGILALLIFLLLIGRLFIDYHGVSSDLKNPVIASVALTFSMAIIILASYIVSFSYQLALYIWYGGIILHALLIILFSIRFIMNFDIKKVFPSYFIVYVGIVVASVTAPAFDQIELGQIIFWFGFVGYMIWLPIVSYRVFRVGKLKDPVLPTISIFTAPAGLCLAGYMSVFPEKNMLMLGWLVLLTLTMIILTLIYLPKMLSVGFYPSFSAFTFPFVITAIGLKSTSSFLEQKFGSTLLLYPARMVEILSVGLVLFVLVKYLSHLTYRTPLYKK